MSLTIQTNIAMINAENIYKVNTGNKTKATERLSSGYRINRAADDAAGLSISEKMRWQIRGLDKGTQNAQHGISWVQTGDGALGEIHSMLHRMKELSIQSLNDTNTANDRAALQAEFDALQSEIDRVTDNAQFNTQNIFSEHEATYYQFEGNVKWDQSQPHVINSGSNNLSVEYQKDSNSPIETISISIPAGIYTTQELTDEIEDAFTQAGVKGLVLEYTDDGTFNLNFEGGEKIESVGGNLAYLIYDVYEGGSVGALVGTTSFPYESSKLTITGENNNMSFTVEDFDGNQSTKSITIPDGRYTRQELINLLNADLAGSGIEAVEYGTGIKLSSNDSIITGFKGNMFKIDEGVNVYTSVFYDNVKYGNITMTSASFTGGAVIPTNNKDAEHQMFKINSSNNTLTFKSNGSADEVTITIPDGEYTVTQMEQQLDILFANNGLELDAASYSNNGFSGLIINSTVKGAVSQVGISSDLSKSSAYETLFVKKVYNTYPQEAHNYKDNKSDVSATFTGSMSHSGSNVPLTITANTNDKFMLVIDGNEYQITLDAGDYADANAIKNKIDEKLNGGNAPIGYKNKVNVSVTADNKIHLTAATGIIELKTKEVAGNNGYKDIFVGTNVTYTSTSASNTGTATTKPTITLNTPVSNPTTIDSTNNEIYINVDGVNHKVTLPTGNNVTHDDITDAIENQIKEYTDVTPNTFTNINAVGKTTSNHFTVSNDGKTNVSYKTYSDTGESKGLQGTAGAYEYNNPAIITMQPVVPDKTVITNSNNTIQLNINGDIKTITLSNGTYDRSRLVNEIQSKIDREYTIYFGGAKVSLDASNRLVLTARLNHTDGGIADADDTSLSLSSSNSSFLKELHTTRTAATVKTNPLQNTINIAQPDNTFVFTYTENGASRLVTLNLEDGTYDRTGFVNQIEKQLQQQGLDIKAELDSGCLRLTTNKTGDGNGIKYSTESGGTSVESLFGNMYNYSPASATIDRDIQSSITINGNTDDVFSVKVNGIQYNVVLDPGTYNRTDFVNMLDGKLDAIGLQAQLTGNRITLTTDKTGNDASFQLNYNSGGTSMNPIFGESSNTYAGVEAEFTSDNKLKLTGTQDGGKLSVSSGTGGAFQTQERNETVIPVSSSSGYVSPNHSYVDGVEFSDTIKNSGQIKIDKWNDELSFTFYDNGTGYNVAVDVPDNNYSFSELENYLQTEIDTQLGETGKVTVSVNDDGVRLEAVNTGNKYYFNNFSGDFFHKVMGKAIETTNNTQPKSQNGAAPNDIAYTVGRKDVRNTSTEIKTGVNDTLSIDLEYSGTVRKITMKLDSGIYNGNDLKDMIQEKLNEQLKVMGLSENMIEVGIGGINTGVTGANDNNALNFKISRSVRLPAEGKYVIDGVSGNAAFSVFYQTDGELKEAYVKGSKDISEGVTIEPGKEELTIDVDGTTYTINIPPKTYSADELITEIKTQFHAVGAPVTAENDNGYLKIFYNKLGVHKINNVKGSAKNQLFFQENGEIGEEEGVKIQLSSNKDNYVEIDRPALSTSFLSINSVGISAPKYANKALERINEAVKMVSDIRSMFGAMQNRMEHSIMYNQNASENTQSAESLLRDADMAEEAMNVAKHNILEQAAQAIMTQINSDAEGVLRLLE